MTRPPVCELPIPLLFSLLFLVADFSIAMSMSPGWTLKDFVTHPAIRRALRTPNKTESVLSFFFGVDYRSPEAIDQELRQGKCLMRMAPLWFGGDPIYDALCQPFFSILRTTAASRPDQGVQRSTDFNQGSDETDGPMLSEVDHCMAKILLYDQLTRNIFRGTPEAFAYEDEALEATRSLIRAIHSSNEVSSKATCTTHDPTGEIYPAYIAFVITPLIHSEKLEDHETALELLGLAKQQTPSVSKYWELSEAAIREHYTVVQRFGRYPHRNKLKGRESTADEQDWLNDVERLPGWAKSQL